METEIIGPIAGVGVDGDRYGASATVTADTTGKAMLLKPHLAPRPATVSVTPGGGGSAKVQWTLSSVEAIEGDTAVWHDWPHGDVTSQTTDRIEGPATAVRLVATSADAQWEIQL